MAEANRIADVYRALVRNQVAAVVLSLAFLFVVEPLLTVIPWVRDHLFKFLP